MNTIYLKPRRKRLTSSHIAGKQYSLAGTNEFKPLNFGMNFSKGINWINLKSKNSLGIPKEPRLRSRILYSHEKISSQVLYSKNNLLSLENLNDTNLELKIPIRRMRKVYRSFTVLSNKAAKKYKSKRNRKIINKKEFGFHFLILLNGFGSLDS